MSLSQPKQTHFILVTLVLVLMLGAPTFYSLTEDSDFAQLTEQSALAISASRAPASLPPIAVATKKNALGRFFHFDLSCAKNSGAVPMEVHGGFVQLQGKSCLNKSQRQQVEILNKTNGYTASIFDSGSDKYQTDLIQLADGDNEISVRYREPSGKTVESVIFIRSL